jgi:uncharacterized protein YndB with AHSA1/START domain
MATIDDLRAAQTRSTTISRVVHGDRRTVWRMWTDPMRLAAWWGPHGFTNPECAIDPRPGGRIRILMRSASGEEYLNVGTVESVDEPRQLVFTISLLDDDGAARLTNRTTVDFEDHGARTRVTVSVAARLLRPSATRNVTGMGRGWLESLARLSTRAEDVGNDRVA